MSGRISLILEVNDVFLSSYITLFRAILEMLSGLNLLLEMIDPRYLKFSTALMF